MAREKTRLSANASEWDFFFFYARGYARMTKPQRMLQRWRSFVNQNFQAFSHCANPLLCRKKHSERIHGFGGPTTKGISVNDPVSRRRTSSLSLSTTGRRARARARCASRRKCDSKTPRHAKERNKQAITERPFIPPPLSSLSFSSPEA